MSLKAKVTLRTRIAALVFSSACAFPSAADVAEMFRIQQHPVCGVLGWTEFVGNTCTPGAAPPAAPSTTPPSCLLDQVSLYKVPIWNSCRNAFFGVNPYFMQKGNPNSAQTEAANVLATLKQKRTAEDPAYPPLMVPLFFSFFDPTRRPIVVDTVVVAGCENFHRPPDSDTFQRLYSTVNWATLDSTFGTWRQCASAEVAQFVSKASSMLVNRYASALQTALTEGADATRADRLKQLNERLKKLPDNSLNVEQTITLLSQ